MQHGHIILMSLCVQGGAASLEPHHSCEDDTVTGGWILRQLHSADWSLTGGCLQLHRSRVGAVPAVAAETADTRPLRTSVPATGDTYICRYWHPHSEDRVDR